VEQPVAAAARSRFNVATIRLLRHNQFCLKHVSYRTLERTKRPSLMFIVGILVAFVNDRRPTMLTAALHDGDALYQLVHDVHPAKYLQTIYYRNFDQDTTGRPRSRRRCSRWPNCSMAGPLPNASVTDRGAGTAAVQPPYLQYTTRVGRSTTPYLPRRL